MVKINYQGRLGNKMFQYALGRLLAEKMKYALKAEAFDFPCTHQTIFGKEFSEPVEKHCFQFIDIPSVIRNETNRMLLLEGTFQRIEYYLPYLDQIKEWYSLPLDAPKELNDVSENDLLIYIRLGDFYSEAGFTLKAHFYEEAIKLASPRHIYIVTDNITHDFVRTFRKFSPTVYSSGTAIHDMLIARLFKKIAISCSTFSWWAMLLADPKEVYYPIGAQGHWSKSYNQSGPHRGIDLRIDDARYIYFYNCPTISDNRTSCDIIPLSNSAALKEDFAYNNELIKFHRVSKAYWFT